ncbi:hypothetical protein [Hymenobacter cellulosilyticus]|uniref:Uncharacterized protein n=1 Tax=Hymenobacter cellulosilyticus TaxID=2932248 RepID=A0A8T9Q500_9BACT|nr:hypothetical protein [Hymenobacter cellulosilyticus]UOQ70968.1 hypothetical protein MUN79_20155 [Hymenobacter cellulosilyticus]
MLGEVEVPVLDTLEDLSFGQASDIGAAIQELGADVPALRLRVLATILQPTYHGTGYDTDQVAEVELLCQSVPLREALPLTDFFCRVRPHPPRPRRPAQAHSPQPRRAGCQHRSLLAGVGYAGLRGCAGRGDKTRWNYFYCLSWAEAMTMIELENHKAHYRHQVHLQQERQQQRLASALGLFCLRHA